MSAHVLLTLSNELGKSDKMRGFRAFYYFFATSLINSIIQEREGNFCLSKCIKLYFFQKT